MQAGLHSSSIVANRGLVLQLLASIACAAVLTLGLADGQSLALVPALAGIDTAMLVVAAAAGGGLGLLFGIAVAWRTAQRSRRSIGAAQNESRKLRRALQTTEAIIKAEAQALVFWEPGQPLNVVTHTLTAVSGVPQSKDALLRFGEWLELGSANDLKSSLEALFGTGRPFNLLIKTQAGSALEAEGRASGPHAVVRFRDVAGYRSDLVRLLDQHQEVSRSAQVAYGLLDSLPFPAWFRAGSDRITWANAAYAKAVDATDTAQVVDRQLELLESHQRAQVSRAIAGGQPFSKRLHLIIDGERRAHDLLVRPLDGVVAAAAIDVTALEMAEGELARQISTYARTLDRVVSAVAIFDRDRRLTFYNDAWRTLWQLDPAWLATKPAHDEILDRLRGLSRLPGMIDYKQWKTKLLSEPYLGAVYEDWWHFPDGRMLHVVAEPRQDGGITYLYDDVTEKLALESRYNALIRVQRETLDSLKEGVAVFGTDGRLKLYNTAFLSIWRLSSKMLADEPHIDKVIAQASVLHSGQTSWHALARVVTGISDKREAVEGQMIRPDESVIDYAAVPLPDGGALITFSDVTASKQYERALLERNEALVAADKLKNQFIGHISYELRTPLTNIIGFSELLTGPRTGPLNQKQREYLNDILGSSTTLLSIIDDILDLATIDAGALELRLSTFRVQDIAEQAVMGVRERAARARIQVQVSVPDRTLELTADESRVRQVLYNLASNAIGFSAPGSSVRITAKQDGSMVVFTVEDDGIGIPKDQQQRVFDRFESRAATGRQRGTGLGLSIVKSLVELHNGDMVLSSEPGRGTRVTVRLPRDGGTLERAEEMSLRA